MGRRGRLSKLNFESGYGRLCVLFSAILFFWIVIGRILGVQGEFAAAVSRLLRCLEDISRLCTDTTPFTLPPIFLLCFFSLGTRGGFEKREKVRMRMGIVSVSGRGRRDV